MRNRTLAAAVGVVVTVLLLGWVLKDVSLAEVWTRARAAHPGYLLATVLAATSTFVLRIFRWRLLLRADDGSRIGVKPLWHGIAIGFMANNLLPFRAGEFIRALAISRLAPVKVTSALSSLLLERLLDGVTTIALLFAGLLSAGLPADARVAGFRLTDLATRAAILCGVLLLACVMALVFPALAKRVVRRLVPSTHLAARLAGMIDGIRDGLGSLRSPTRVLGALAWSVAIWGVNGGSFLLGFRAFDIGVGYGGALLLQTFLLIGIAAPSTPGYFGPFEAAIKAVLILFAVDPNVAVSYGLTYHFTTFLPITLLGLWSLTSTGISLKDAPAIQPVAARPERDPAGPGAV